MTLRVLLFAMRDKLTIPQSINNKNQLTKQNFNINNFSKHLFWDTNRLNLNTEKNKSYIIKQVLEYGLIEDWSLLLKIYGIEKIAKTAKSFRELDKKALSFVSFLSQIPIEDFRCYNYQQSIPQHWNF